MKCSTCFRENETDPCPACSTLTKEERALVRDGLRQVMMLNAVFEMAFGAKPPHAR